MHARARNGVDTVNGSSDNVNEAGPFALGKQPPNDLRVRRGPGELASGSSTPETSRLPPPTLS